MNKPLSSAHRVCLFFKVNTIQFKENYSIIIQKFALCYIVLMLVFSIPAQSQSKKYGDKSGYGNLTFGIKAGTTYSKISDLDRVLVSETYYTGYDFKNLYTWGGTAGVYINYKMEETILAIYSEIMYTKLGSLLKYSDVNDFNYDLQIKYNFIAWEMFCKAYVYKGLNIGVGPNLAFNITPDGLFYTSNGEATYGPDIRVQQDMRNVLKGKSNFSIGTEISYEFDFGVSIEAKYYYGLGDIMETLVNNYHFIETKNACNSFRFTIGYALPYSPKFH
jgi:hypothetical protein